VAAAAGLLPPLDPLIAGGALVPVQVDEAEFGRSEDAREILARHNGRFRS
jgi:hypothetical protein